MRIRFSHTDARSYRQKRRQWPTGNVLSGFPGDEISRSRARSVILRAATAPGATNDRRFRAFDSRDGEELWVTELEMSAFSVPITYFGRDGKQYVAVVAAAASALNDPSPDSAQKLIVLSLP